MHHNILNSNQLAEWKHFETEEASYELDQIDDYYNCMIDAEATHSDKRICTEILNL
jgi:hypothetical protein